MWLSVLAHRIKYPIGTVTMASKHHTPANRSTLQWSGTSISLHFLPLLVLFSWCFSPFSLKPPRCGMIMHTLTLRQVSTRTTHSTMISEHKYCVVYLEEIKIGCVVGNLHCSDLDSICRGFRLLNNFYGQSRALIVSI